MKEVYQNRNGDKAPIFIISQFRRFIKANSKMPLGQFGRGGQRKKSPYVQQKRNILSNIGNMFMGKQKKMLKTGR